MAAESTVAPIAKYQPLLDLLKNGQSLRTLCGIAKRARPGVGMGDKTGEFNGLVVLATVTHSATMTKSERNEKSGHRLNVF